MADAHTLIAYIETNLTEQSLRHFLGQALFGVEEPLRNEVLSVHIGRNDVYDPDAPEPDFLTAARFCVDAGPSGDTAGVGFEAEIARVIEVLRQAGAVTITENPLGPVD